MYINKNDKTKSKIRMVIDILNVILGIAIMGLAVFTFIQVNERLYMFPYIFLLGAAMNLITGVKHFISEKKIYAVLVWVFAVILVFVGSWSSTVIGGI